MKKSLKSLKTFKNKEITNTKDIKGGFDYEKFKENPFNVNLKKTNIILRRGRRTAARLRRSTSLK